MQVFTSAHTMNTLKQAIAGPSRRIHSVAIPTATDLPPVISRYIQRHLSKYPSSTAVPNPFLVHRSSDSAYTERYISRRREKQLRYWYDPSSIPPSPLSIQAGQDIQLASESGEVRSIQWAGDASLKTKKTLYEGRRVMFKGHKHEREKPERRKETEERLAGMDKRIEEWKKVSLQTRIAA